MTEQGLIHDVRITRAGSQVALAASVGALVLTVQDAGKFYENGGSLVVTSLGTDGDVATPYVYTAADLEADTITLDPANPLELDAADGDPVEVSPPATDKQAVVLLDDTEEAVTAEIVHALRDLIPEGIRDEDAREYASLQLVQGTWMLTDLISAVPISSSSDYTEGFSGWELGPDGIQMSDANVLGTVGADTVTANTISLGELDLVDDVITPLPLGLIAHGIPTGTVVDTGQIGSVEAVLFNFNIGSVHANRVYKIGYNGNTSVSPNTPDVNDVYLMRIRYTKDGTQPSITSEILDRSAVRIDVESKNTVPKSYGTSFYYLPTLDYDTVILGVTMLRESGTGLMTIQAVSTNYQFSIFVEDMGAVTNVGGTLSQRYKASGASDADPVATYTKVFGPTDTASYDWTSVPFSDGGEVYQGRRNATRGNTKSIVCFNDASIRTALTGATVKSIKLTFRVHYAYSSGGMHAHIKAHNFTTPPSVYSADAEIALKVGCQSGGTYTVTLPNSFGTALKNGTAKGVSFYGPDSDIGYYGYLYGVGSGYGPRLTITYSK